MPGKKRNQSITEFRKLIDKYVRGKASKEEVDFLNQYYAAFENKADLLDTLNAEEVEKIGNRLKNRISEEVFASTNRQKKVVQMKHVWMRAAIVIGILLASGLGYYLIRGNGGEKLVAQTDMGKEKETTIAPGGNKAILTLADGTKVILDSASNGAITKQGNVTVIKLNDGLLSYEKATDKNLEVVYNTITTPRGGQYQLVLADGSKVWLNAASSIKFPNAFPGKDRKVEITGEAYFEVAHNAAKPFYVAAGGMEVQVLGTHFNVNAYTDEPVVKTTLLEGSVRVTKGSESKTIIPGEQARIENSGDATIHISKVDVNEVVAWKNGLFHFNNSSLKEVMRQLSRWYDIDVEYAGGLEPRRFGGEMSRNADLNQVLKILEESKVHFEIVGKKLLVKP